MRSITSIFSFPEKDLESLAASKAEVRRLAWHLDNLKIVRIGRFQSNVDELVNATAEKQFPAVSV